MSGALKTAVVGAGWAGLAAAVEATSRGQQVTLFEMAPVLGGRARSVDVDGISVDNGQHICIGAYVETLRLLRLVGVEPDDVFLRTPLALVDADSHGLRLRAGPPLLAFARGVFELQGWAWRDRTALLTTAAAWALARFDCEPALTVAELACRLPPKVCSELIDPLCVAALNTPADAASARVFLRVLRDALCGGAGSSDLLLPRVGLGAMFPEPAARWLAGAGAQVHVGRRVDNIARDSGGWRVDGAHFDRVIVATSAIEASRLLKPIDIDWARSAAELAYEPIVTVYVKSDGAVLPHPMLALHAGADAPAQFAFDRGQLGGPPGLLAFVISGAAEWVELGRDACLQATLRQARAALGRFLGSPLEPVRVITEKRATFRCTPLLRRPAAHVAEGLQAAGDYVAGPYPATLEGAVRSGTAAARAAMSKGPGP